MSKQGIVKIHGKEYKTVALRVQEFREKYPALALVTELVKFENDECIFKTIIVDGTRIVASGYAHESKKATQINNTSFLEVAETSSIGRALACFGLGGEQYASADEVLTAIHQQNNPTTQDDLESAIKEINKAESVEELMVIYKKHANFDNASLAKLKKYLSDRKLELGE